MPTIKITFGNSNATGAPSEFDEFMSRVRVFALGAIWAGVGGLTLAASEVLSDWYTSTPIDWHHVEREAVKGVLLLLVPYYLKHKALLAMPPTVAAKLDQAEALTASAAGQMVEQVQGATSALPEQVAKAAVIQDAVAALKDAPKP